MEKPLRLFFADPCVCVPQNLSLEAPIASSSFPFSLSGFVPTAVQACPSFSESFASRRGYRERLDVAICRGQILGLDRRFARCVAPAASHSKTLHWASTLLNSALRRCREKRHHRGQ